MILLLQPYQNQQKNKDTQYSNKNDDWYFIGTHSVFYNFRGIHVTSLIFLKLIPIANEKITVKQNNLTK